MNVYKAASETVRVGLWNSCKWCAVYAREGQPVTTPDLARQATGERSVVRFATAKSRAEFLDARRGKTSKFLLRVLDARRAKP